MQNVFSFCISQINICDIFSFCVCVSQYVNQPELQTYRDQHGLDKCGVIFDLDLDKRYVHYLLDFIVVFLFIFVLWIWGWSVRSRSGRMKIPMSSFTSIAKEGGTNWGAASWAASDIMSAPLDTALQTISGSS